MPTPKSDPVEFLTISKTKNFYKTCSCLEEHGMLIFPRDKCIWQNQENLPICKQKGVTITDYVDDLEYDDMSDYGVCPDLPDVEKAMWDCPGEGKNAEDLDMCSVKCNRGLSILTHTSTKKFTCRCKRNGNGVEGLDCRWGQRPHASNKHPDLVDENTDLTVFSKTIVWPVCEGEEIEDDGEG